MASLKFSQDLLDQIDAMIKSHEIEGARNLLSKITLSKVPSGKKAELASLARRAGNFKLGLKILSKNIFGVGQPEHADLMEYVGSLRRLGLINQAMELLSRSERTADSCLNEAFCYVQLWDYEKACERLQETLTFKGLSPTQKRVATINYIASLEANGDLDLAESNLDPFLNEVKENHFHLYLNALQLKGKIAFHKGQFDEAINILEKALNLSGKEGDPTSLLIDKWVLLSRVYSETLSPDSGEVEDFKNNIRTARFWEALRDFEWRVALKTGDFEKIKYTYFGSPFPALKKSILKSCDSSTWDRFYLRTGKSNNTSDPIDFLAVRNDVLPYGKDVHRLMMILSSDFFQPWTVPRIFTYLYPTEIFDPSQSHNKIYRLIGRTEAALHKMGMKQLLSSTSHGYRLRPEKVECIKVYDQMVFSDRESLLAYALQTTLSDKAFDVEDALGSVSLSKAQWYRALKEMEEKGVIEKKANSRSLYCFKKQAA